MADKTNEILVNVVLDRSGSMKATRDGTISGYNEYLNGLRADKDSNYFVSLTQFDAPMTAPELTITYLDKPLSEVTDLTAEQYEPRGNTPLYDAIGECVRRVEPKERAVICLIITDGAENASREFTADSIKKLIAEKEKENWQFVFLGANIDSFGVGASLGMNAAYTANYAQGHEKAMFAAVADSSLRFAGSVRTFGASSPQARASLSFKSVERDAMMGGRPAAPPPFQPQPHAPRKEEPKKRDWKVSSD